MSKRRIFAAVGVAGLIAATVWAAQATKVTMNGKTVSGRTIDGSVYVKLSDVASAFDLQVAKSNGGYALVQAGGADQLNGIKGKVGTEIFTGKWKFLVKDVQRVPSYMLKYANTKFEMNADDGGDLVIVNCRFKNGLKESVYMYFNGMADTALTDTEEHGYKVKWMDVGGNVADTILPGAAKDFAMVFGVPKEAKLKDLIYSIEPVDIKKYGLTNLRIALN